VQQYLQNGDCRNVAGTEKEAASGGRGADDERREGGILTSGRGDLRPHSRGSRLSDDFVKRNVSLASRLRPNAHTYTHVHARHADRRGLLVVLQRSKLPPQRTVMMLTIRWRGRRRSREHRRMALCGKNTLATVTLREDCAARGLPSLQTFLPPSWR